MNVPGLLVRLLMGACLLTCLVWLAICFLLTPIVMCKQLTES